MARSAISSNVLDGEPLGYDAIVLLQMGGPENEAEIEPFLESLFADADIIRLPRAVRPFQPSLARLVAKRRTPLVAPRYAAMGGGSPLQRITAAQAAALEKELGVPVLVAMRYTKPRVERAVEALRQAGHRRVLLLPLYPHYSLSTTGSSLRDLARVASASGLDAELHVVERWGSHPAYVELLAQSCLRAGAGTDAHLVLSAHGVPERYVRDGDPYKDEVEATAAVARARLRGSFASVSNGYQSGLGPVKWIGPDTPSVIRALAASGAKKLVLSPLGFVSDHIETMYDMDTLFAREAKACGFESFVRVPSFNESREFARVLAEVARGPASRFEVARWTR